MDYTELITELHKLTQAVRGLGFSVIMVWATLFFFNKQADIKSSIDLLVNAVRNLHVK